jgi:hypothetical protein
MKIDKSHPRNFTPEQRRQGLLKFQAKLRGMRVCEAEVIKEWREHQYPLLYFIRFRYTDPFTGKMIEEEDHAGPRRPKFIGYGRTLVVFPQS